MARKKMTEKAKAKEKVAKDKKENSLEIATFLDKKGKTVKVLDIIDKETGCWFLRNKGLWIITHASVEKIANIAGISNNYIVEESSNIQPTYTNEMEHIVRVTIKCKAKKDPNSTSCVHSDEDTFTVTGESNRLNTPHRGRSYLRKMAEKRGFDIAVLKHLGLYTTVFSEEEAEEFKNDDAPKHKDISIMPGSKEFESIIEEINLILNSATREELKAAGKFIKARVAENAYNERQYKYLKELFNNEVAKKIESF